MNTNYLGALLITVVALASTFTSSITHHLAMLSPFQILFAKSFTGLFCVCVLNYRRLDAVIRTQNLGLQATKAFFGAIGNFFWIMALQRLLLSDASALSLTSALFTTIGAHLFLREKINIHVFMALILGFSGVLFIMQPSQIIDLNMLLPLASALCFSVSSLLTKRLTIHDSEVTTLFYLLLFMGLFSAIPAFSTWHPLKTDHMLFLGGAGFSYFLTQWALIKAYTIAAAGFIAPFKFARFPLAALFGFLIFGEIPTLQTQIGAAIILISYVVLDRAKNMPIYKKLKQK